MSSPTLNAAIDSRPRRTVYALADRRGWYLLEPGRDFNDYTPDVGSVLRHNMAWLTVEVAKHKRDELIRNRKLELNVARIELVLGANNEWQPASTEGVAG
jgi:hypothetical protein